MNTSVDTSNKIVEKVLKRLDSVSSKPEIDSDYHDKIHSIRNEQHKEELSVKYRGHADEASIFSLIRRWWLQVTLN